MKRRSFFASAAAAAAGIGSIPLMTPKAEAQARSAGLKITSVELWRYTGDAKKYDDYLTVGYPKGGWLKPAPNPQRPQGAPTATYIKINTDGGISGFYGPVSETTITARLVGQNPVEIEALTDGIATTSGLAAINNCLWDLKAKILGVPVYQALGGNRKTINCYATTYGMPLDTVESKSFKLIAAGAARVKKAGFTAQKWFPEIGPDRGAAGLEFNVGLVKTVRQTCGEYYDVLIDGHQRWDLAYSQQWCKLVEQYHPFWLENPVVYAHEIENLPRLRQMTSIPIATGEQRTSRWDFFHLLLAGGVDYMQPEPERMGTTEILRICALASVWGLKVSPHHNRINALSHIVASQNTEVCPIVEYRHNNFLTATYFEKNPIGHNGKGQIELSDRPGYGLELDDAKIVKTEMIFTTQGTESAAAPGSGGAARAAASGTGGARGGQ